MISRIKTARLFKKTTATVQRLLDRINIGKNKIKRRKDFKKDTQN